MQQKLDQKSSSLSLTTHEISSLKTQSTKLAFQILTLNSSLLTLSQTLQQTIDSHSTTNQASLVKISS